MRRREEGGPAGWRTRRRGEWDTETQDGEGVGGAGGARGHGSKRGGGHRGTQEYESARRVAGDAPGPTLTGSGRHAACTRRF